MDDLTQIKQRLDALEMRRVHQSDIPPSTIKQRHMGQGNRFIRSGLEADLPSSGEGTSDNSSPVYYATDTGIIYTWNGSMWLSGSETFISDKIISDMIVNGNSFDVFSPELFIKFTPKYTKKYIIFGNFSISMNSTDDSGKLIIDDYYGNSNILVQNLSGGYNMPADTQSHQCYVYTIAELNKGIEYYFTLKGKQDYVDKFIMVNVFPTYGVYLVAQSL